LKRAEQALLKYSGGEANCPIEKPPDLPSFPFKDFGFAEEEIAPSRHKRKKPRRDRSRRGFEKESPFGGPEPYRA
jgi:hypothetical protein